MFGSEGDNLEKIPNTKRFNINLFISGPFSLSETVQIPRGGTGSYLITSENVKNGSKI